MIEIAVKYLFKFHTLYTFYAKVKICNVELYRILKIFNENGIFL